MSSGSRSLHRKRRVLPRMNSLGCWRSLRIPLLRRNGLISLVGEPKACESVSLPHQDHLLLEFTIGIVLRADFVVEVK